MLVADAPRERARGRFGTLRNLEASCPFPPRARALIYTRSGRPIRADRRTARLDAGFHVPGAASPAIFEVAPILVVVSVVEVLADLNRIQLW